MRTRSYGSLSLGHELDCHSIGAALPMPSEARSGAACHSVPLPSSWRDRVPMGLSTEEGYVPAKVTQWGHAPIALLPFHLSMAAFHIATPSDRPERPSYGLWGCRFGRSRPGLFELAQYEERFLPSSRGFATFVESRQTAARVRAANVPRRAQC